MKINKKEAIKLGILFNIDFNVVPINEWIIGLNIELEHGKKMANITNITNNNKLLTAKITIAHLLEDPRYYYYLDKMEKKREKYYKKHNKPSIFLTF